MSIDDISRSRWTLVSIVAVVFTITAGYIVFASAMERQVENAFIAQLEKSVGLLADRFRDHADHFVTDLRAVAARCAAREDGAGGGCAADLEQLRQRFPGMVAATAVVDRGGMILGSTPDRPWGPEELAAFRDAVRGAEAEAGPSIRVSASAVRPGKTLLVFAAFPKGVPKGVGGLGASVELSQVASDLLEGMAPTGGGVAFLAGEDGRVMGVAGAERWRSVESLADLLGPESAGLLLRSDAARIPEHGVVKLAASTAQGRMLGALEPVRVSGSSWILGALAPAASLGRDVRPILFGGAVLMALALAGVVATTAAWRRARAQQAAAVREAATWRGVAQQKQREGRWKGLADACGAAVVGLTGSKIVEANRMAAASLVDGDPRDLIGKDFLGFAASEDRELLRRYLDEQRAIGASRRATAVRFAAAGGRVFVGELNATAVRESDEELSYVAWEEVGTRQGGESLRAEVAGAAPLPLVLTDLSGNLLWANAAAFDRADPDLGRLQGRPLRYLIERSDWRVALSALARARRGEPTRGKLRVSGNGGAVLPTEFRAIPLRGDGCLTGVLFAFSEFESSPGAGHEASAVTRERALAHLSASLAHRVRNNVQALLGLLDRFSTCEEAEHDLSLARGLVADSVEDLRRFFVAASRGESGILRPVRVGALLGRWIDKATPGLPENVRITLRREARDDRVVADAEQIPLWLDVSLSSALATMELGGAVEVELSEGEVPGTVRLTFSDTGSSAPPAALAGERQRFSSRQTAQAVAELVAARLGGRAGSTSGSGLRNRLWIELKRVGLDAAELEAGPSVARVGAVLLADDEEMVRMPLATALRGAGHEVVEASNGLEAVEKVLAAPDRFALVVLDLVMPVMDGREALRRLRDCAPALPVVVCTGYDPSGDDVLAAAGVLIKPFTINEFLDKVAEFARQDPAGPEGGGNISQ